MQAVQKRRERTIAARIRSLVMIPTSALIAIWLVITFSMAWDGIYQLLRAQAVDNMIVPAAEGMVNVMHERSATIAYIEDPQNPELKERLTESREESDATLGVTIEDLVGITDVSPGLSAQRIETLYEQYEEIDGIRSSVDSGTATHDEALEYYDALMTTGTDVFDTQARLVSEAASVNPGFTATYMFRAIDLFARTDTLLSYAFATGELSREDQREFTQLVGSYEHLMESNAQYLEGEGQQERYEALVNGPEYTQLLQMQRTVIDRVPPTAIETNPTTFEQEVVEDLSMPIEHEAWAAPYEHTLTELIGIGTDEALHSAQLTGDEAWSKVFAAIGTSLGVAAVVGAAFLLARRGSEGLTTRLLRLRDDSRDLAENRLPDLMRRVHQGERVDTRSSLPELTTDDDEIGDVAKAFNTAQRAAVEEAVQQTELRHGVNRVFLNIAHRSQTLVHRQLRLLDAMEREQEDPEQLAQLFKLDHLATRSRRNAENLLILGGEAPGRTWHRPMPLIDVLRGAISESGDYTRVKRERIARVNLHGPAVADVIHLVAELIDNAAMFSPPHTQVRISSEEVPHGATIEIEDRGLGMTGGELADANALLTDPPEFDVMRLNEKMRLGLFVVSHLAHRHDIKVHLRSSPYGGVQAIVLLPQGLITETGTPSGETGDLRRDTWQVRELTEHGVPGLASGPGNGAKPALAPVATPVSEESEDEAPTPTEATITAAPEPVEGPAPHDDRPALPSRRPGGAAATDHVPSAETPDERPSLPKRRPQENLAPQLAAAPSGAGRTEPAGSAGAADPSNGSPDGAERLARLRRNMSAFQKGTDRGRRDGRQQIHDTDKDA
ncbi:nitrate- and nitrite sensing domain-containing protein [Nocardiopsis sp. CNT312]|uniref:sensor histidine kinase n=1 Tax=Nocardiopsis sp. CNT312 TaxID=1137268 RepID=UPI00048C3B9A|nr:nitrate- and nitrite sensing domain-containing protein [Nocardiopsis sp. CNT312]